MSFNPSSLLAPHYGAPYNLQLETAEVVPDWYKHPSDGTDDLPSFNRAKAVLAGLTPIGGRIRLLNKQYNLSDEFDLDQNGLAVVGQGTNSTVVVPIVASKTVFRIVNSNCQLRDLAITNSNSLASITGLRLAPILESGVSPLSIINYCLVDNLVISGGTTEGIVFRTGPKVGGADSECYFNQLSNIWVFNSTRSMWFENTATNPDGGSGANANIITNLNIVATGGSVNTGIQIDQGSANIFVGGSSQGINVGTSPNTTPTAVLVANQDGHGGDNNYNLFLGFRCEANTLDWDIRNPRTIGLGIVGSTVSFPNGVPSSWQSGDAASAIPNSIPGFYYQSNGANPSLSNAVSYATGLNGFLTSVGPVGSATYFYTKDGTSGNIANNATFTITIPTSSVAYRLNLINTSNVTIPAVYDLGSDGSSNQGTLTATKASTQVSVSLNALTLTVTNTSGVTSNIKWTLVQDTP